MGVLLLFAALLAAVLAKLFGSVALGILAAMLLYAAGVAVAGRIAWKALSAVRPNEFPATGRELERDWEAIRDSLAVEAEGDFDDEGGPADDEPDEGDVEDLEARLRGGTDVSERKSGSSSFRAARRGSARSCRPACARRRSKRRRFVSAGASRGSRPRASPPPRRPPGGSSAATRSRRKPAASPPRPLC